MEPIKKVSDVFAHGDVRAAVVCENEINQHCADDKAAEN